VIKEISTGDYLAGHCPLIDVRSPAEYAKGHIPGAVNIPLFSDEERAVIGTLYTKVSAEKAMETGYRTVLPKLDEFIVRSREAAPDGRVTIHCWRGGMRSRSFARHLADHGFSDVSVITGGYKAYRNQVIRFFDTPFQLQLIGGFTGSGKTEIIQLLRNEGHQAIDLEQLANHKGSVFGSLGQEMQPTTEQFENNLFDVLREMNPHAPVWMEDESRKIGSVTIPLSLFNQMQTASIVFLDIPVEARIKKLVLEYAKYHPELIEEATLRLTKRLGAQHIKTALDYLNERNFTRFTSILLTYYDKKYRESLKLHDPGKIRQISSTVTEPVTNLRLILKAYE
jgi:tRNA 2-selenouridine synthase